MKAIRYTAPGDFRVADVSVPAVGPFDLRIRTMQVGVCGTDLHLHRGDYPAVYPLIPGHEVVGEVEQVGGEVHR